MKTRHKIIAGTLIALTLLVSGIWLAKDDYFAAYLEDIAASKLNIELDVSEFKSQPFKGLLQWRIKAQGLAEGALFNGEAQVALFPLRIIKHQLKVDRFPLISFNELTKKRWQFEFERGWTDIHSWGSIESEKLSVRAKLHLQEFEISGDGKPAGLAGDENLLNMLVHVTGIPLDVQIEGSPHNPTITWKRELPGGLNMMKNIFGPLFKQFQTPDKEIPPKTPRKSPESE